MKKTITFLCLMLAFSFFSKNATAQYSFISQNLEYSGCDSLFYRLGINTYLSSTSYDSLTVLSYFGDGSASVVTALSGTPRAYVGHHYTEPGIYTVKSILMYNGVAEDTVVFADTVNLCSAMHIVSYIDHNTNCHRDAGEGYMPNPYTIEVDSAGVPVDTITSTSFYYAGGGVGTIYAFKVLTLPSGYVLSCPADSVVYDTLSSTTPSPWYATIGFICAPTSFDLHVWGWFSPGVTGACSHVYAYEYGCASVPGATLTINYSTMYAYSSNSKGLVPTSSVPGSVTFPLGTLAPDSIASFVVYFTTVGAPAYGDTTHTTWTVYPITGDAHPENNVHYEIDSVHSSFDPNEKSVSPQGAVTAGTMLQYAVGFENTGSDTAFNIHIQDTLSADLDVNTFKLVSASAEVSTELSTSATGQHIVKFDFAHINLLDASHSGNNSGMVIFSINTRNGLPNGTVINNRAGIYFDYNPVVMTNTTTNIIGTPASVSVLTNGKGADVYPNPAFSNIRISIPGNTGDCHVTIYNSVGSVMIRERFSGAGANVDVSALAPGVYFVNMRGDNGVQVVKFVKE